MSTWDKVTDSRIATLDARVQLAATRFINRVEKELGITIRVTQARRTIAEQNELYAQGRSKPGKVVTNAKGGCSFHNFGLAIDVVIIKDGKAVWTVVPAGVVKIAKEVGFEWGGDWKSFKDYPHFQMTFGQTLAMLRKANGILMLLICLLVFACGTKKKNVQRERTRSVQEYSLSADSSYKTTSEIERVTRTVTDSTGTSRRTFANAQGTFAADGSFTGTAESVTDERTDSKWADGSSSEKNKQGSDKKGSNQVATSTKQDEQREHEEKETKPPDPVKTFGYTMAAGIAFLILSFLAYLLYRYRDPLKTLLNRISNIFKSK